MSSFELLTVVGGTRKRRLSTEMVLDLSSVRVGADNLEIAQGGSGAGAYLDFFSRSLRTSFSPVHANDLTNLAYVQSALAGFASGAKWQDPVISVVNDPSSLTLNTGDRYLVGTSPVGDFATKANNVAVWNGSAWVFYAPISGWALLVDDQPSKLFVFGSTSWGSKDFESTTASGFLSKVGFDIQLTNLQSGKIILGDASNVAQAVTITGDATLSNSGVLTIGDNAITSSKINDGAVTASKIGANAVGTSAIADDAVTKEKINADVAGTGLRQNTNGSIERDETLSYTNDNASALSIRTVIYIKSNGNIDIADATNSVLKTQDLGVVEDSSIASGNSGKVVIRDGALISGFTGLVPGQMYYLNPAVPGAIALYTAISWASGHQVVEVGRAKSSQVLDFRPRHSYEY